MEVKLRKTTVAKLTAKEIKILRTLTMSDGLMIYSLERPRDLVTIAYVNNVIVGWTSVNINSRKDNNFAVYVKPSYRGKGIGTMLIKKMLMYVDKNYPSYCYPWSDAGRNLFQKFNELESV